MEEAVSKNKTVSRDGGICGPEIQKKQMFDLNLLVYLNISDMQVIYTRFVRYAVVRNRRP